MKKAVLLLLSFVVFHLNAQNQKELITLSSDSTSHCLSLCLSTLQPADNLLIFVSDACGATIFLDNKRRFSGNYEKLIDLSAACPGYCTIRITQDNERFEYRVERHP